MNEKVSIRFMVLRLPLKLTVRHAAASRKEGESLWVCAKRGGFVGFGEGCPRDYVTGETMETCSEWLLQYKTEIEARCLSLHHLQKWSLEHALLIDKVPSAWCAVECALLDLFAREKGSSVESMLRQVGPVARYCYTAVLSDTKEWLFDFAVDNYLTRGLSDFAFKLSGAFQKDKARLMRLDHLCKEHGLADYRVRLDANNLWPGRPDEAIEYLRELNMPFFAVEEPVGPREVDALSRVSLATNRPVVLDESICSLEDLKRFDNVQGQFVANLKVSKVGGICRGIELIEALRARGWPIIVGAHVGETSLLTRAALLFARAAGDSLLAHDGAFGSYLLEWDPAEPDLKFGRSGVVDLTRAFVEKTVQGLRLVPLENWDKGWGMNCCMSPEPKGPEERIQTHRAPDGYNIHYRLWGPETGEDVLVLLHGGMGHSRWHYPLAQALLQKSGISVLAPDRRGCGLNSEKGDLGTVDLVIQDLVEHLLSLKGSFKRIHLGGWCQGAQFASVAAARLQHHPALSSLVLLTPGFFWNDRFRSVIDIAEKTIFSLRSSFKAEPERNKAFVPIPMQATDFTFMREWLAFIQEDTLKTTKITLKSGLIMDEIQEMSWSAVLSIKLPVLMILAAGDRIVDNRKANEFLSPLIQASPQNRVLTMDAAHAVQFERTDELADNILSFIESLQGGD
jgi:L-alanine-DL-glutamate epimerase-like enolase superfamily enzyme/pimeloyl-ACP methyl ester carboxylesterase